MLEKIFSSNKDNKNVSESLNKKEADAKTLTEKKYNKSNLVKSNFYCCIKYKNFIAFLLNQNIHIYQHFMIKPTKRKKK